MQDLDADATTPPAHAHLATIGTALLLAVGVALMAAPTGPAQAQDTMRVAGTTLAPDDSTKARRLLRTDLGPTSRHWTRLREANGRFHAAKTFFRLARLAYPVATRADSMLAYFRKVGARHPDPTIQAEFLYGGLQLASSSERPAARKQFYRRLTENHPDAHYAEEARRLFAPDTPIQAGKALPAFEWPRLADSTATVTKSDFAGQVVLIDFWGSWCGPCIRAMPHLHEAYREHKDKGFTILSVAMRDTRSAVQQFRDGKWAMPWHHAFVPKDSRLEERVKGRFDVSSFPTAILVGPDGTIRHVSRGMGSGEEIAGAIAKAVEEKTASGE
jgi:thiol-disulfide isomerase/thioredoxin